MPAEPASAIAASEIVVPEASPVHGCEIDVDTGRVHC